MCMYSCAVSANFEPTQGIFVSHTSLIFVWNLKVIFLLKSTLQMMIDWCNGICFMLVCFYTTIDLADQVFKLFIWWFAHRNWNYWGALRYD